MKCSITMIVLATLLAVAPSAYTEEIRIEGGPAAITTVFSPIKEAYESSTGDTLTITLSTASKGLSSLEKGSVDLASLSSFAFSEALAKTKSQGVNIDPATLVATDVSSSTVVIFLNKANPVKKLSKNQLKAIFTGRTTNWRDVGGNDSAIVVYWGKDSPYVNKLFTQKILDGEPVTSAAKPAGDVFDLREIILANPTAIVINSSGLTTPSTKVPEIPIMNLPITVYTKGAPSAKVQRLLKYYKEEFGYMDE